jgi:hypothetical protein
VNLPSDEPQPKTNSFIPIIADLHPLEPIPTYQKPVFLSSSPTTIYQKKPQTYQKCGHLS